MVYRGKPSAGCENCRKAKKRCDLEQPACTRCVKLKKTCSGYRDTTALQIHDESESVRRRAEKQQARASSPQPTQMQQQFQTYQQPSKTTTTSNFLAPPTITDTLAGIPTPGSIHSDSTSSSDDTIDFERELSATPWLATIPDFTSDDPFLDLSSTWSPVITRSIVPKPDDVATTYFFNHFTGDNHWTFMRHFLAGRTPDPCLDLAIKACGMAALGNVENIAASRQYAQSMYTVALGLLNDALRDPKRSKTDESLIAVAMLGRYENLACDSQDSIQSWKAHIRGSTQLLKVRGKSQFKTFIGRIMFREMRAQAMINCIWEDDFAPSFFRDYQAELDTYSNEQDVLAKPVDRLTGVCFDLADLRAKIQQATIPLVQAAQEASEIEAKFIQWAIDTTTDDGRWRYSEIDVEDSEHVWDGKVYSFSGLQMVPTLWMTYFNMRIMLTRVQEGLCRAIQFSDDEREEQAVYFRRTRRQMTDDICASVPVALGHSSPAYTSPCVLVTAYGALWPLFFAGTCALERSGPAALSICRGEALPTGQSYSKSVTQAQWIFGRLTYISERVGLKWADGVARTLKGDFMVPDNIVNEDDRRAVKLVSKPQRAMWLRSRESTPHQVETNLEQSSLLSEALANEFANDPVAAAWIGAPSGISAQLSDTLPVFGI